MRLIYTVSMEIKLSYTVQYGNETHQSCSQLYSRLIPRCLSWMSLYQKHSCAEHQHTNQHTCDYQSKNQPVNHLAVCLNTSHGFSYVLAYLLPLAHTRTCPLLHSHITCRKRTKIPALCCPPLPWLVYHPSQLYSC